MSDCIFCKIVAGEIPCTKVFEDEQTLAFNDINPRAPVHVLIIPKQHFDRLHESDDSHVVMLGRLMRTAGLVARETGIAESGYRVRANQGESAGQVVFHFHLHVTSTGI